MSLRLFPLSVQCSFKDKVHFCCPYKSSITFHVKLSMVTTVVSLWTSLITNNTTCWAGATTRCNNFWINIAYLVILNKCIKINWTSLELDPNHPKAYSINKKGNERAFPTRKKKLFTASSYHKKTQNPHNVRLCTKMKSYIGETRVIMVTDPLLLFQW